MTASSSTGRIPPEEHLLITARNARITLDHGFTSAYSAGSLGTRFEIALRDEIEGGWLPGPRLKASSIERAPGQVFGIPQTHDEGHGRGAAAMRAYIKACAELGLDSVKLLLSGDDNFTPNGSQELAYDEDEVAAAGDEAQKQGIWLACHAQAAAAVKLGLKHGFRVLYHCSYADAEALDMLEAKKAEIFVAPAVGLAHGAIHADPSPQPARSARRSAATRSWRCSARWCRSSCAAACACCRAAITAFRTRRSAATRATSSSSSSDFGFTPAEALMAATKWGGEIMGMGDELGLVKEGYLADLLLVDGDPTEDIAILQDKIACS